MISHLYEARSGGSAIETLLERVGKSIPDQRQKSTSRTRLFLLISKTTMSDQNQSASWVDNFACPYLQFATRKGDTMRSTTRLLVGAAFVIGFVLGWVVKGDPVVVGAQAPAKPFMM